MNILSDGVSVLFEHWRLIFLILLVLIFGQVLTWAVFKKIFGERLTPGEYVSLGLAGWIMPVMVLSALWFLWEPLQGLHLDVWLVTISMALLVFVPFPGSKKHLAPETIFALSILVLLFALFVFLRLVFISRALLPLYFDSAQHYMIIKGLMGFLQAVNASAPFDLLTANYYHQGFHLLALFITSISKAEIADTMLVLGQIILAVIPFSAFFLIKHETKSNSAGLFALLLAGFGWYMPAHVLDWGKYPALTSLLLIQFVLSMAYLYIQYKDAISTQRAWTLLAILVLGVLISIFTHSRSLIIFGIVMISYAMATHWRKLPHIPQWIVLGLVSIGIVSEIVFIQAHDILYLLFDPYGLKSWFVTLSVLFLFGFALRVYPQLTFSALVAIFLMIAGLFVPVRVPGFGELTLLDRPYVEMILYFPLALIGGLGLAGLEGYIFRSQTRLNILNKYIGIPFICFVLINALLQYDLYPSDCCIIAGADDLVAIDWMDRNLPSDARILVSAVELRVLAFDSFQGYAGGDAGIWIRPLTDRSTIPLLNNSDFTRQATLNTLCDMNANYLYIGAKGQTFDDSQISVHPEWYKLLLSMPKAKVYQLVGCD